MQQIDDLMRRSGVGFGTSGARGRVEAMTDAVCFAYTTAFLQHLEQAEGLASHSEVAIGGDLRPSTPRIMAAVAMAIAARGHRVINCGHLPSPALALYGIERAIPSIMVTGSHIPDDRNGIKFNKTSGEILKADEGAIRSQPYVLPLDTFDAQGGALEPVTLPAFDPAAGERYIARYLNFFPAHCLAGLRLGLYEHSSVARDLLCLILEGLGAEVVRLGRSDRFVPVDTEAVRPEDVELARRWAAEHRLDSIISTDGDGDRPLVSDRQGNWLRGDVAGVLCARYLGADAVVTPISSNTAVEKSGFFTQVVRTRIGSPFVIEGMQQAIGAGAQTVVGYEANGGFLSATPITLDGRTLPPLPTRDAAIVPLAIFAMARAHGDIGTLVGQLPARFTASDRVRAFPTHLSQTILQELLADPLRISERFGQLCGNPVHTDNTDGLRITFENQEIVHLRPSGNAPEFRCYVETASAKRSRDLLSRCIAVMEGWKAAG